jgi:hypothetical protein
LACHTNGAATHQKGWEVKNLATVAEVNRALLNARTAPEELHYIDISSVSPDQIDTITAAGSGEPRGVSAAQGRHQGIRARNGFDLR